MYIYSLYFLVSFNDGTRLFSSLPLVFTVTFGLKKSRILFFKVKRAINKLSYR